MITINTCMKQKAILDNIAAYLANIAAILQLSRMAKHLPSVFFFQFGKYVATVIAVWSFYLSDCSGWKMIYIMVPLELWMGHMKMTLRQII